MAQVNYTIPDDNIQYFIDAFGDDYDLKVSKGEIENSITKAQYAKDESFKYLARYVRNWKIKKDQESIQEIDITE